MRKNSKIKYTPKGVSIEGFSGYFLTTRLMIHELLSTRELIWRLFVRDFSARYRQSALGVAWAAILPLVTVGVFLGMRHSGILNIKDVGMPYPLYAIIGLTIWNLFSAGLAASSRALVNAGSMVIKINFAKDALVIASSAQALVDLLIRLVLILCIFIYYGIAPSGFGLLIGVLCMIPIFLMMIGIGFVLSLATVVLRDIPNFLNLSLTALMLLTPILYPISGNSILAQANKFNPLNYLVNVPRDFMIKGHTDMLGGFAWATIVSIIVFYTGWRLFYSAQSKIAERI